MAFRHDLEQLSQRVDALVSSNASSIRRYDPTPYELAKAAIILDGLKKDDYARMDEEPTPEEIEEARQVLLAEGVEWE
jgi:hypothetical protein